MKTFDRLRGDDSEGRTLLMSIKPRYAEKIFEGSKSVELRRTRPPVHSGDVVVVYVSSPVKAVVGYFVVGDLVSGHPQELWSLAEQGAGVTEEEYHCYFSGADRAYAISVSEFELFEAPRTLAEIRETWQEFHPPQSYWGLKYEQLRMIMNE